jgi:hypothetical protein
VIRTSRVSSSPPLLNSIFLDPTMNAEDEVLTHRS